MPGILVASMLAFGLSGVFAGHAGPEERSSWQPLRPQDKAAHAITEQAVLRSDTIRSLLRRLAQSDLIVYVVTSSAACRDRPVTRLTAACTNLRYVSISLPLTTCRGLSRSERPIGIPDNIAWLGHELRHAAELGEARSVRDQDGVRRLFTDIGFLNVEHGGFETRAALEIQKAVAMEVSRRR